jgi:hypothetical protein
LWLRVVRSSSTPQPSVEDPRRVSWLLIPDVSRKPTAFIFSSCVVEELFYDYRNLEDEPATFIRNVGYQYLCAISGFLRHVNEIFALLGCYKPYIGNNLPTFRYILWVPSFRLTDIPSSRGADRLFRNFGNYQSAPRDIPEEREISISNTADSDDPNALNPQLWFPRKASNILN